MKDVTLNPIQTRIDPLSHPYRIISLDPLCAGLVVASPSSASASTAPAVASLPLSMIMTTCHSGPTLLHARPHTVVSPAHPTIPRTASLTEIHILGAPSHHSYIPLNLFVHISCRHPLFHRVVPLQFTHFPVFPRSAMQDVHSHPLLLTQVDIFN